MAAAELATEDEEEEEELEELEAAGELRPAQLEPAGDCETPPAAPPSPVAPGSSEAPSCERAPAFLSLARLFENQICARKCTRVTSLID